MSNINRVIISGRLTRDPDVRATAGGMTVMSLGVAVNDRRKNQQSGQWEDYTNFIDCKMFGTRAESLSRILTKGMLVCIEGKLRWSSWERDGQKRSKIEVMIDEIELPSRSQGQGQQGGYVDQGSAPQGGYVPQASYGAPAQGGYAAAPAAQQPPMDQAYDDEIPF